MKITSVTFFLILAVCIGFLSARLSAVQPTNHSSSQESTNTWNDFAEDDLERLMANLETTKQTDNLKLLNDYIHESQALHDAANISLTATILQYLRDGRTNETINFLESHLDVEITTFAFDYQDVRPAKRATNELKPLRYARDYRNKFPQGDINHPEYYHGVTNAFKLLDEQSH